MANIRTAQGLGDLEINLDKADEEAGGAGGLPDIPVDDANEGESTPSSSSDLPSLGGADDKKGQDDDLGSFEGDFKESLPEIGTEAKSTEVEKEKAEAQVKEVVNQLDKAKFETEILNLKTQTSQLQNENDVLYERLKSLQKTFNDHILYKIPKFEEVELPGSYFDPEYVVPHISNALDKFFLKIFKDMPIYTFKSFEIIDKDASGNIENAVINAHVEFERSSSLNFLRFDLELFLIDGYLQIPQWFMFDKKIYRLTEEGVRQLDVVANRMDKDQMQNVDRYEKTTWFNMGHENRNPAIPNPGQTPMTYTGSSPNVWNPKNMF